MNETKIAEHPETLPKLNTKTPEQIAEQIGRITVNLLERANNETVGRTDQITYSGANAAGLEISPRKTEWSGNTTTGLKFNSDGLKTSLSQTRNSRIATTLIAREWKSDDHNAMVANTIVPNENQSGTPSIYFEKLGLTQNGAATSSETIQSTAEVLSAVRGRVADAEIKSELVNRGISTVPAINTAPAHASIPVFVSQ